MTKAEFNEQFLYLQKAFGSRVKEETAEVYFDKFEKIDKDLFTCACHRAIEEETYFPKISKLLEICNSVKIEQIKKKAWIMTRYDDPGIQCPRGCPDDGILMYNKIEDGYSRALCCRCDCEKGQLAVPKCLPSVVDVLADGCEVRKDSLGFEQGPLGEKQKEPDEVPF